MALVKPFIFQVVGYQNSGKTTVVSQLIHMLKNKGLHVAAIKHHGHGGRPDIMESKDSSNHIVAGAAVSLVEGGGRLLLQAEQPSWSLAEEIELAIFFKPDVILIEGHKRESYPKLLLVKQKNDLELLKRLKQVEAVFIWDDTFRKEVASHLSVPCYQIGDPEGMEWLTHYILEKLSSPLQ